MTVNLIIIVIETLIPIIRIENNTVYIHISFPITNYEYIANIYIAQILKKKKTLSHLA